MSEEPPVLFSNS